MSQPMEIPAPVVFPPAQWPPRVSFRNQRIYFQPATTMELLTIAAHADWATIIWGGNKHCLIEDDSWMFLYGLLRDPDDAFGVAQVRALGERALEMVSATTWGASTRLASMLKSNWFRFLGWCAESGFKPDQAHLSELLAASYHVFNNDDKEADRYKFHTRLWPLKEVMSASTRGDDLGGFLDGMTINADGTVS